MKPPAIPTPRAFAVAGRVPAAVLEALAEARRIRDAWSTALAQAAEEGRAQAQADGQARYRRGLRALHLWAARERTRLREEARRLALALAERLVAHPLPPEALTEALASGLWLRVRLSPGDAEALGPAPEGVEIKADSALSPGDVVLEGPAGRVDARAATRLRRLLAGAEP